MPDRILLFLLALACFRVAHDISDHWLQSDHQATTKGQPGWAGRLACAAHVATYTLTQVFTLLGLCWWLSVPLSPFWTALGISLSAVTHYVMDRRTPLRWVADHLGAGKFYRLTTGGMNGAYLLDQAGHHLFLFLAAVLVSGPS